jgi:UTP--glucose-1-phosphate uridylyltransferase
MLPVGRQVVAAHVLAELVAAGITDALTVLSLSKLSLIAALEEPAVLRLFYTMQRRMGGLGDAVAHAQPFTAHAAFVVALPDTIITGDAGALLRRMLWAHQNSGLSVVATQRVAAERVSSYGILTVDGDPAASEGAVVRDVVEKPSPAAAASRWAISARYVLTHEIYEHLEAARSTEPASTELGLSEGLARLARAGRLRAVALLAEEERLDIGSPAGYRRAFATIAAAEP